MKSAQRIQKITSKGQVTIPSAVREQFTGEYVSVKPMKGGVFVAPVHTYESEEGWDVIFSADRDNNGKGISADAFVATMREIAKEREKVQKTAQTNTRKR